MPKTMTGCLLSCLVLVACTSVPDPNFAEDDDDDRKTAAASMADASSQATLQSAPITCGDRTCAADESCSTCPQDCGACKCAEAPACSPALRPPPSIASNPGLNVNLELKSKAKIIEQLRAELAAATPAARALAAALSPSTDNEEPSVGQLRDVFAGHPAVASQLRAQLTQLGMGSPVAYRAQFPVKRRQPSYELKSGPIDCGPPQLSVRVAKITVDEEDDDFEDDIVYCSVSADSPKGSELRVTPKTPNLDEGDSHEFSLAQGVVWGQEGPRETGGDLVLTYDCFEVDANNGYGALLGALAREGAKYGRQLDQSGWVSTVGGTAARLVPLLLTLDSDDHLFEASQTIPASEQLKMTRGATWTVRKSGTHYYSDWDWTLRMEAWGCTVHGGGTAPVDAGPG